MLIIRTVISLGVLAVLLSASLGAQERGRGGRTPAPSSPHPVRAPEGTRERPVSMPIESKPVPAPPPVPVASPKQHLYPSPAPTSGLVILPEHDGVPYDGSRPITRSNVLVYFSGGREGYNVVIGDYETMPDYAGFDFSEATCVPFDDRQVDMFFEDAGSSAYMVVGEDSEIQDLGRTSSLHDINALGMVEWSRSHDVVLEEGRSYVVKTWEGYHAMFRVMSLVPDRVVFDWIFERQSPMQVVTHGGIRRTSRDARVKTSR